MFGQEDSCADKFLFLINRVDPDSNDDKEDYESKTSQVEEDFKTAFKKLQLKGWNEVPPVMALSCLDVRGRVIRQKEKEQEGKSEWEKKEIEAKYQKKFEIRGPGYD